MLQVLLVFALVLVLVWQIDQDYLVVPRETLQLAIELSLGLVLGLLDLQVIRERSLDDFGRVEECADLEVAGFTHLESLPVALTIETEEVVRRG